MEIRNTDTSLQRAGASSGVAWPGGKKFAFTIIDDTDTMLGDTEDQALARIRPVYDLLLACGLKTTKTTWVESRKQDGACGISLEHREYRNWILDLRNQGMEIALHGTANDS